MALDKTPHPTHPSSCKSEIPSDVHTLFNYRALVFQVMCVRFMSTKIISLVQSLVSEYHPSKNQLTRDEVKTRRI